MTDIRDRISQRLDALDIKPRAASLASGMSADAIRDIFRRPENSPTLTTIEKLAVGLKTNPRWLAFGEGDPEGDGSVLSMKGQYFDIIDRVENQIEKLGLSENDLAALTGGENLIEALRLATRNNQPIKVAVPITNRLAKALGLHPTWLFTGLGLPRDQKGNELEGEVSEPETVRLVPEASLVEAVWLGYVEAGSWREVSEFTDLELDDLTRVFRPRYTDYPEVRIVSATVRGDSMNALEKMPMPEGTVIVGLEFEGLKNRVPLRTGMVVIVEQKRDGGLLIERSVKQLEIYEDRYEFHPRSTNPKHKPIIVKHHLEEDGRREVSILAWIRSVHTDLPY